MTRRISFVRAARRAALLAAVTLAVPLALRAQAPARPLTEAQKRGTGDTSIFAPLELPPGNIYRSGSGAPGSKYWQQRADYLLRATLDTAAKSLTGEETLRYTNNSPDTLRYLWLQVEQNAFKSGSMNSLVFPSASRFGARDFEGGDVIDHLDQTTPRGKTALKSRVEGTMMKVDLAGPLAPGATVTLSIGWHFNIPEHGADRMGRDGALYELAQWYPRVAVYDDLRGWNTEPYLGQGEFYLEYGDYELYVTVPAGYIVAATGALQNQSQVLTATQIARLNRARTSDTTIHIITQEELASGAARPKKTGTLTWHFSAKNVRDAVWAASPDYMWDASAWKGHMAFGYYRPSAIETWKEAADMSRMSIKEYSERWFEYPWPHISAVEGPISGMEYPMIAMENRSQDKYDLYNVVTHEIGHMWYPMIVGSNERAHMWQDEGFNTFINYFSEGLRYPEKGTQTERALSDMRVVEQYFQYGADRPLEINPDRISPALLGENAYVKTAVGLQILRDEILGQAAFDDAFRTYTARWAFKHPSPADFFRTMEDAGGRRLDYFWREWFTENPVFDQSVDSVGTAKKGDTINVTIAYGNKARGVLPIHARLTFSDGSTENFDYPAEVWSTNTAHYLRQYSFVGKQVVGVEVDPDKRLPDIDRSNNAWRAAGAPAVAAPRT